MQELSISEARERFWNLCRKPREKLIQYALRIVGATETLSEYLKYNDGQEEMIQKFKETLPLTSVELKTEKETFEQFYARTIDYISNAPRTRMLADETAK